MLDDTFSPKSPSLAIRKNIESLFDFLAHACFDPRLKGVYIPSNTAVYHSRMVEAGTLFPYPKEIPSNKLLELACGRTIRNNTLS